MRLRLCKFFILSFILQGSFVLPVNFVLPWAFANKVSSLPENVPVKEYSFRPLLIHGKKDVAKKTKDLQVETGATVQSEVFFVDQDFKARIFKDEGFTE